METVSGDEKSHLGSTIDTFFYPQKLLSHSGQRALSLMVELLYFYCFVFFVCVECCSNQAVRMLECRDKPTPDMFGELLRNASNMGDLRNCPVRNKQNINWALNIYFCFYKDLVMSLFLCKNVVK